MDWTPVKERIIKERCFSKSVKLTIGHINASTDGADEQVMDEFYTRLQGILETTHDMLIAPADTNAIVV